MTRSLPLALACIALAASVSLIGSTILVLLDLDAALPPPAILALPEPHALAPDRCFHDRAIGFVEDRGRVWVPCGAASPHASAGALLRLDPARGRVESVWPLTASAPWYEGLAAVRADRGIAWVYRAAIGDHGAFERGGIAALIASDDGFTMPPRIVAEPETELLGVDHQRDVLHLALRAAPDPGEAPLRADVTLIELPASTRRTIARDALCRELDATCRVVGAWRSEGAWHFVLAGMRPGSRDWLYRATIDGAVTPIGSPPFERSGIDFGAAGRVLDRPFEAIGFALIDGRVQPVTPSPAPRGATAVLGAYALTDEGMRALPRFTTADRGAAYHLVADRLRLVQAFAGEPAHLAIDHRPIARLTAESGRFLSAAWVERAEGGHYLVAPEGYAIALDAAGERVDRIGPVAHARALWLEAPFAIGWMFGGLPVLLVFALPLAAQLRRRFAHPLAIALTAAAGVFIAVSLAYALPRLWALPPA